ncbi:MAG: metallopeptidase family protein [Chloroflexi bacterium]|nr:metallopeptidase family protein [Chloroflexota bacterium]
MRRHDFERIILRALEQLPAQFRDAIDNLDIEVRWRPTVAELRRARVRHGSTLFGVYLGVPLPKRTHDYTMTLPDKIIIYQEPHERFCATEEQMIEQARKTLLHEIGHYLGIEERRLRELGLG